MDNFSSTQQTSIDVYALFNKNIEKYVSNYVFAYFLPVGIILAIFNNLAIIIVIICGNNVKHSIGSSLKIYYLALATSEGMAVFPIHLTYFLGMQRRRMLY